MSYKITTTVFEGRPFLTGLALQLPGKDLISVPGTLLTDLVSKYVLNPSITNDGSDNLSNYVSAEHSV